MLDRVWYCNKTLKKRTAVEWWVMRRWAVNERSPNTCIPKLQRIRLEPDKRKRIYETLFGLTELTALTLSAASILRNWCRPNFLWWLCPSGQSPDSCNTIKHKRVVGCQHVHPNVDFVRRRILLCTPAWNCSAQRCVSALRRVKNVSALEGMTVALLCAESWQLRAVGCGELRWAEHLCAKRTARKQPLILWCGVTRWVPERGPKSAMKLITLLIKAGPRRPGPLHF